jgi:SAM-dependent methyltransferase
MQNDNQRHFVDMEETASFYNSVSDVWPADDMWHQYSRCIIESFVRKHQAKLDGNILNAGSGGNTYKLTNEKIFHLDIADNLIKQFPLYTVASVEKIPFSSEYFDNVICVGSVINYCDAIKSLSEIARVLKRNGYFILEYESSHGYEHRFSPAYMQTVHILDAKYFNQTLKQWVFSPKYIKAILRNLNFHIMKIQKFHIASGLKFSKIQDENISAKYTKYDKLLSLVPPFSLHANNEIYLCKKL